MMLGAGVRGRQRVGWSTGGLTSPRSRWRSLPQSKGEGYADDAGGIEGLMDWMKNGIAEAFFLNAKGAG